MAAPDNVEVKVVNSTLAHVHWEPVVFSSVRGHLKGYKVTRLLAVRAVYYLYIVV